MLYFFALVLATTIATPGKVAVDPSRQVAVWDAVTFDSSKTGGGERERIRTVLAESLDKAGWALRPAAPPSDCEPRVACLQAIGAKGRTPYVVRLSGQPDAGLGFTLTVELYATATDSITSLTNYSDISNLKNLGKLLSDSVVELLSAATRARKYTPSSKAAPASIVLWDARQNPGAEHQDVHDAIVHVLTRAAWSVREASPSASCGDMQACIAGLAGSSNARYVLRLNGEGDTRDLAIINLELFSASTATFHKSNLQFLNAIAFPASKFIATVTRSTTELLALAATDAERPSSAELVANPLQPQPASTGASQTHWLPWTLLAVAVPVTAYGAWALYKNGETSNSATAPISGERHRERFSSRTLGIACLASGIGTALLAGVIYIFEPTKTTSVAFSPTSVDFSVRF